MLQVMMASGMTASTFTTYLPYITESFKFSNASTALIITIRNVFILIGLTFMSREIALLGLRKTAFLSGLLGTMGYFACSVSQNLAGFYIGAALIGLCNGSGSLAFASIVINRWFFADRSLAFGVCTMGSGIAVAVLPRLISYFVESVGLHKALLFEAVLVLAIMLTVFLLVRDDPRQMSVEAWGSGRADTDGKAAKKQLRAQKALSPASYTMVAASMFLLGAGCNVLSFLTLLYTNNGYSTAMAASISSAIGLVTIFSKMLFGWSADNIGGMKSCVFAFALLILGSLLSALSYTHSTVLLVAAICCHGVGWPMGAVGIVVLAGIFSTEEQYEHFAERFQLYYSLGNLLFSYFIGLMADVTAGYIVPFICCAAVTFCSMLLSLTVYIRHIRKQDFTRAV